MKKIITIFIIVHLYLIILDSQVKFQRAIGGTGRDIAYSITQTTDGGYAVAGFTNSSTQPASQFITQESACLARLAVLFLRLR